MHLGHLDQPLLLFGGPYSNLHALLALKKQAIAWGIPPHRILCTGDVVAYCGQPYDSVEMIREWGIHVLMGNCEESLANNADDCGCGFTEGSSCDLLSAEWFHFANKQLTGDQRDWFAQLPRSITFRFHQQTCLVVHGSVTSINQFLFPSSEPSLFTKQCQKADADIFISGHSGIPFSKKIANKLWHNAGAIGMPANDGTSNTWFSTMSIEDEKIKLEHHKLHYAYQKTQSAMIDSGLNNGYTDALSSGLWPSTDVLPEFEKRQQGIPLSPKTLYF